MGREPPTERLASSHDVRAACHAACAALRTEPGLLPSVYLERGGRLRLQSAVGYWQAVDGLRPYAGIIGTTYATGRPQLVEDVEAHAGYLRAAGGIVSEASAPIRQDGHVIGVLNLEARRPITAAEVLAVVEAADALGVRIGELGGVPGESVTERLLRHVAVMAGMQETAALERATLDAALDVSGFSSGVLLSTGGDPLGDLLVRESAGPLADLLEGQPQAVLRAVTAYAAGGTSVSTTGGEGVPGEGFAELAAQGVRSLVALGVGAVDGWADRVLLLVDREAFPLETEDVERLELLAANAAACLRTAASLGELRTQAATDPLTGLGHHASFERALPIALGSGRTHALVLADVDGFKAFNDRHGHVAGDRALRAVAGCLEGALRRGDGLFRIGGDEFAAILPVAGEAEALDVAGRLHEAVAVTSIGVTVSVGVAVAVPGEAPEQLRERADRALYRVKADGRDGVALDEHA